MSCLGIDVSSTVQGSELDHITVEGIEATDALGRAICQSQLTVRCEGVAPLNLDLKLSPDDLEPVFSGAAWAGTVLWRAAAVLVDRAFLGADAVQIKGRTVSSWAAAWASRAWPAPGGAKNVLGAVNVALTEQQSLVDLLTRNVAANFSRRGKMYGRSRSPGRAPAPKPKERLLRRGPLDVIVCCDCVYVPLYGDSWKALLEAIDALAGPATDVLISLERRHVATATTASTRSWRACARTASRGRRTRRPCPLMFPRGRWRVRDGVGGFVLF